MEIEDGICTGRPGGPLLWRAGKAAAVQSVRRRTHDIDLARSYAYSNGDEDVPFLRTVGRPRALNPGRGLADAARHYSWPIARFRPRGRGGPRDLARTAAGIGGMLGGFATGLAVGALSGSRREAVDLGIALGGELGSALAGVRLDVQGAEHLAARPAVFLFNHQSQLDVLVLAKLLRGGLHRRRQEGAWRTRRASGWCSGSPTSPSSTAATRRRPARRWSRRCSACATGISLVIAPEGTRSATPTLGPFKKGAFHVAMQAGVPIVPVVIRNAGELMWRGATTIQSGTVQVRVLPPIPTDGWTVEELDERVAEVRGQYLETLANWSGARPPGRRDRGERRRRAGRAPGRPARLGHGGGDEPPRDGDVARRRPPTRGCGPTSRCWSCWTPPRTGTGCAPRTSGPRGWCRGCGSGWSSRALGVGAPRWVTVEELDLDRHLRRRPPRGARVDARSCSTSSASSRAARSTGTGRCGRCSSSRASPTAGPATWSRPTTARPTAWAPSS